MAASYSRILSSPSQKRRQALISRLTHPVKNIFLTALSTFYYFFFCQVQPRGSHRFLRQPPSRIRNTWGFFPLVFVAVSWVPPLPHSRDMAHTVGSRCEGGMKATCWLRTGCQQTFPSESPPPMLVAARCGAGPAAGLRTSSTPALGDEPSGGSWGTSGALPIAPSARHI